MIPGLQENTIFCDTWSVKIWQDGLGKARALPSLQGKLLVKWVSIVLAIIRVSKDSMSQGMARTTREVSELNWLVKAGWIVPTCRTISPTLLYTAHGLK